jgi:hypothetical protein
MTGDWAGQVAGAECEVPQATFFQGDRSSSSYYVTRDEPQKKMRTKSWFFREGFDIQCISAPLRLC